MIFFFVFFKYLRIGVSLFSWKRGISTFTNHLNLLMKPYFPPNSTILSGRSLHIPSSHSKLKNHQLFITCFMMLNWAIRSTKHTKSLWYRSNSNVSTNLRPLNKFQDYFDTAKSSFLQQCVRIASKTTFIENIASNNKSWINRPMHYLVFGFCFPINQKCSENPFTISLVLLKTGKIWETLLSNIQLVMKIF